jgi:hypothetical protein
MIFARNDASLKKMNQIASAIGMKKTKGRSMVKASMNR